MSDMTPEEKAKKIVEIPQGYTPESVEVAKDYLDLLKVHDQLHDAYETLEQERDDLSDQADKIQGLVEALEKIKNHKGDKYDDWPDRYWEVQEIAEQTITAYKEGK